MKTKMRVFVCEHCGKFVEENGVELLDKWEVMKKQGFFAVDFIKKMDLEKEPAETPRKRLYHTIHSQIFGYGPLESLPCGPMHEETEQEYFLRWNGYIRLT